MRQQVAPLSRAQRWRLKVDDLKREAVKGWHSAAFAIFLGLVGAMVLAHAKACEEVDAFCVVQAVSK